MWHKMCLDLTRYDASDLTRLAREYEDRGYVRLAGAEALAERFRQALAERLGVDHGQMGELLDPHRPTVFSREVRQRLSRIDTSPRLAAGLLEIMTPILTRLIGPLVHVSSTFHGQFKGGAGSDVDHGGYEPQADFMEVHGAYRLHQDFTGASLPTSPSAVTLWVPLNTTPHWALRVYPGSHRKGLLSSAWLPLDDPRLGGLGGAVELPAERGTAILFNALLLHGTGAPGPDRRVSVDLRFFPLCGFLPSPVHFLDSDPLRALRETMGDERGPTLAAPLLEDRAFLGDAVELSGVPERSVLNWVNYVACRLRGRPDLALSHLVRFANHEFDAAGPATFAGRFHDRPLEVSALRAVHDRLRALTPGAPPLADLDGLLARLAGMPAGATAPAGSGTGPARDHGSGEA